METNQVKSNVKHGMEKNDIFLENMELLLTKGLNLLSEDCFVSDIIFPEGTSPSCYSCNIRQGREGHHIVIARSSMSSQGMGLTAGGIPIFLLTLLST